MANTSRAVFLSCVLFLGCWWGTELYSIPVTEDSSENFFSSSEHLDKNDLSQIVDEILLQASNHSHNASNNETRTSGGLTTWSDMDENKSHLQSNSRSESEWLSHSNNHEEHLAKIVDEILLQALSNSSHPASKNATRKPGELIARNNVNERAFASQNSPEPEYFIGNENKIPGSDGISEKMKTSSLFNRDLSQQLTTKVKKETSQETVSPDAHSGSLPCGQLLRFLQKNIVSAAIAVAAILLVTVLLVLMLTAYIRGKQPLYPPANMTYNIFIMNGKAWWQKSHEKSLRKFAGIQKRLKGNSCV